MRDELIAAVRRVYDSPEVDVALAEFLELSHPDVELLPSGLFFDVERPVYQGHNGVRRYYAELAEAFGSLRYRLDRLTDYGDVLVAELRVQVEGGRSGVPAQREVAQILRFRGDLIDRAEGFADAADAHAAARELSSG